jgi:hypothetical protein
LLVLSSATSASSGDSCGVLGTIVLGVSPKSSGILLRVSAGSPGQKGDPGCGSWNDSEKLEVLAMVWWAQYAGVIKLLSKAVFGRKS